MTDKIKAYNKLINMPRSASLEEEMEIIESIRTLIGTAPNVKTTWVVRYIRDTGTKMVCVYESRLADEKEIGFIISELMKKYPNDRIFASPQERYEVEDGLE